MMMQEKPFLKLIVNRTEDDVNAVETLRKKLDSWNRTTDLKD